MTESLDAWIDREYRYAASAMLNSISPVDLVKMRAGFGQTLRARRGAVVASPVLASYDPDPDYFFHWYRDSAVVVDALRLLFEGGSIGPEALTHVGDFVRFSRALQTLDGRLLVAAPAWRKSVAPDFVKFLRDDGDLASVHGAAVWADTRVNPDGTLDISSWNRPQHDGPPLTALALLRWSRHLPPDADLRALVRAQLDFTLEHWQRPSFDIWEEEKGQHYYTLRVAAAALREGAGWLEAQGEGEAAARCRKDALAILHALDGFWLADEGHYRSRILTSGLRSTKELDIAVILSAIHAGDDSDRHSVHDPRMHATLARLDALFDTAYAINRERPPHRGPAMGRYAGDVYYSGGAYYFSSLGAAEFCYRAARGSGGVAASWLQRGDAYLETVRAFTPPGGELSEQFDRNTGDQTSARHLAWSYAAFISCVGARRALAGPYSG